VRTQQSGWIRLRQNLPGEFDGLPGALYLLAIIVASTKNLKSGSRAGVRGHRLPSRDRIEKPQKHLPRFGSLAAKGKAGFLRAAIRPAFSHHISALSSKLTTVGNCPVGSVN
jgi:hypothetical protein